MLRQIRLYVSQALSFRPTWRRFPNRSNTIYHSLSLIHILVGGGLNEGVPSTDLTITGGDFRNCCGGNLVTESGIDARISGTSKLTIDGADLTDGHYNQIYCGSNVNFYADYDGPNISTVSYTHLDVYKRQILA